jgi:hypothetical protein
MRLVVRASSACFFFSSCSVSFTCIMTQTPCHERERLPRMTTVIADDHVTTVGRMASTMMMILMMMMMMGSSDLLLSKQLGLLRLLLGLLAGALGLFTLEGQTVQLSV